MPLLFSFKKIWYWFSKQIFKFIECCFLDFLLFTNSWNHSKTNLLLELKKLEDLLCFYLSDLSMWETKFAKNIWGFFLYKIPYRQILFSRSTNELNTNNCWVHASCNLWWDEFHCPSTKKLGCFADGHYYFVLQNSLDFWSIWLLELKPENSKPKFDKTSNFFLAKICSQSNLMTKLKSYQKKWIRISPVKNLCNLFVNTFM